jgi:hypothetical protein
MEKTIFESGTRVWLAYGDYAKGRGQMEHVLGKIITPFLGGE